MPILKIDRAGGETDDTFMSRCISDGGMKREYPDHDQRVAVCLKQLGTSNNAKRRYQMTPSHLTTQIGDKIIIHDLELFVGYDRAIDEASNTKIRKYDRAGVRRVVERTQKFMERDQRPKLILGHNPEDLSKTNKKRSIGDVISIRMDDIHGVPGILGDVEMTLDQFELYIRSNGWPRRSAEIWPDGFMSEVALLGAQTPARPLPDTKFNRKAETFARELPPMHFEGTMGEPGATNVNIPSSRKKARRRYKMPDPNIDEDDREKMDHDEDEDEEKRNEQMQRRLRNLEDENFKLKHQLSRLQTSATSKDRNARTNDVELDQVKRDLEDSLAQSARMDKRWLEETYGRKLDALTFEGYRLGDREHQQELLDRIVRAHDPEHELAFQKVCHQRDPIGVEVNQVGARGPSASRDDFEKETIASKNAQKRCENDKTPEKFDQYFNEELEKVA